MPGLADLPNELLDWVCDYCDRNTLFNLLFIRVTQTSAHLKLYTNLNFVTFKRHTVELVKSEDWKRNMVQNAVKFKDATIYGSNYHQIMNLMDRRLGPRPGFLHTQTLSFRAVDDSSRDLICREAMHRLLSNTQGVRWISLLTQQIFPLMPNLTVLHLDLPRPNGTWFDAATLAIALQQLTRLRVLTVRYVGPRLVNWKSEDARQILVMSADFLTNMQLVELNLESPTHIGRWQPHYLNGLRELQITENLTLAGLLWQGYPNPPDCEYESAMPLPLPRLEEVTISHRYFFNPVRALHKALQSLVNSQTTLRKLSITGHYPAGIQKRDGTSPSNIDCRAYTHLETLTMAARHQIMDIATPPAINCVLASHTIKHITFVLSKAPPKNAQFSIDDWILRNHGAAQLSAIESYTFRVDRIVMAELREIDNKEPLLKDSEMVSWAGYTRVRTKTGYVWKKTTEYDKMLDCLRSLAGKEARRPLFISTINNVKISVRDVEKALEEERAIMAGRYEIRLDRY